jgi:hypothetical protein
MDILWNHRRLLIVSNDSNVKYVTCKTIPKSRGPILLLYSPSFIMSERNEQGETVPFKATEAYRRSRGTAPLILHVDIR